MRLVFVTLVVILGCGIQASTPHCDETMRNSGIVPNYDYYYMRQAKIDFDLDCYEINNLPSKELQFKQSNGQNRVLLRISFHDSNIKTIPPLSFYEFPSIEDLNLMDSGIEKLETNCFLGLKKLKRLQLYENNISNIDAGILSHLFELNYLDLSNNSLKNIDKGAFQSLTVISDLLLNYNKLEVLPDEVFSSLHGIRNIDLSWNNLSTLSPNIFRNLTSLYTLNLSNNKLNALPPTIFRDLSNLNSLNMPYNSLTIISHESLAGLESLTSLDISNNKLTTLNFKYNCPDKLNSSSTNFTQLCSNKDNVNNLLLEFKNLKELSLGKNNLSKIENETFKGFTNLTRLDLSFNQLREIHNEAFKGLSSLTDLSLDNNILEILYNGTFSKLSNLYTLLLNNNKIRALPVSLFKDLRSLTTLSLSNNLLTNIPYGLLSQLKELSSLDLSHNQLVEINPISFHYLTALESLDITYNNVNTMDFNHLMSTVVNLKFVFLNKNNWTCEVLFNIINYLLNRGVVVENGHSFDVENVHGIQCTPTKAIKNVFTSRVNERRNETNDFQKHISNVLVNITETLSKNNDIMEDTNAIVSNLAGHGDEEERVKDQNIQEGIFNNSRITVNLLASIIQLVSKNEQNLRSNFFNKTIIQSKEDINDIPGSERLQNMQTPSKTETVKTYIIIILSIATMAMVIIIGFTHCYPSKRSSIIDRIRSFKSQQQGQSSTDLVSSNDVEIINTQI